MAVPPRDARSDRWGAAVLAAVAVAYLIAARRYPVDTLATPGPGLFPLVTGGALLVVALWQFAAAGRAERTPAARIADRRPGSRRNPLILSVALVLFTIALPRLGFVATAFALVLVASRLMGVRSWWRAALLAVGITVASRIVFVSWLGVPLP